MFRGYPKHAVLFCFIVVAAADVVLSVGLVGCMLCAHVDIVGLRRLHTIRRKSLNCES